jgi:Protein of unknown function (DUF2817)
VTDTHFSHSYAEARRRFITAAQAAGATLQGHVIDVDPSNASDGSEPPTVDVAILGADNDPALLITSGIHGVEGYFGSAVQLALLERLRDTSPRRKVRYVLVHALNPYGFAQTRRVNEDNVDLNRNFMAHAAEYTGAPAGYAKLDGFLNPRSAPPRHELFKAKALWKILRLGMQPLKEAVAGGQYDYPHGLFFGGKGPSASMRIVQSNCDAWLAAAPHILHIDLHTGLGAWGKATLLLNEAADSDRYAWYTQTFDPDRIEPLTRPGGTAYCPSGPLGLWMQRRFHTRDYRFAGAEFGTYDVIRLLSALRAENRAHFYCTPQDGDFLRAKNELRECFCPDSPAWRQQVVSAALRIMDRGIDALSVAAS